MTSFDDVYEIFLFTKVQAYKLNKLTLDNKKATLLIYLRLACSKFINCKQDLSLDLVNKRFNVDLTEREIDIITDFMVISWLKPIILSDELLESRLNTKDFYEYSPANLILQIRTTFSEVEINAKKAMKNYGYSSNFSQLNKK